MTTSYSGRLIYSGIHIANALENGKKYAIKISSNVPGDTKQYYLCQGYAAEYGLLFAREVPNVHYPMLKLTAELPSGENRYKLSQGDHTGAVNDYVALDISGSVVALDPDYMPDSPAWWIYQGSTKALYAMSNQQVPFGQIYYDVANDQVKLTSGTVTSDYPVTLEEIIEPVTALTFAHTVAEIANAYSWTDAQYITADWYFDYENNPGTVLCTHSGTSSNRARYYTANQSLRLYSGTSSRGSMYINAPTGYKITKFTVTFTTSGSSVYCYCFSNRKLVSGTEETFDTPQATITLSARSSSGGYVSGNVQITALSITCEPDA